MKYLIDNATKKFRIPKRCRIIRSYTNLNIIPFRFEMTDEMLQQVFRAMCENNRKCTASDSFLTPVFTIIFHKSVNLKLLPKSLWQQIVEFVSSIVILVLSKRA